MNWRVKNGAQRKALRILGPVSLLLASSCSEKTPQFDLPAEVATALEAAGDLQQTKHFVTATGSIADLRDKLVEGFPQIQALIDGEGQTSEALIHELSGTPDPGLDQKLMFIAYALENRGETEHLPALRTFLADNLQSALHRTRHMVTRAIEVLETGSATGTGFYDGIQMAELMETPGTSTKTLSQGRSMAAARNSITCIKRYLLKVDGKPVSWIQGQVYSSDPMKGNSAVEAEGKECQATVALHGGTYVDDEAPAYPGRPTRTFNCAGYGLKGFNKQEGALIPWTVDPEHARKNLIDTGLLVEITDDSEALPSDLVFYFGHSGRAGHVAVINSITGAGPLRSIIVRNGDGPSGLWEDEIDSTYYFDKWYDASSRHKFKERRIYRWKNGPPSQNPTPRASGPRATATTNHPHPTTRTKTATSTPTTTVPTRPTSTRLTRTTTASATNATTPPAPPMTS